jgi:esterase
MLNMVRHGSELEGTPLIIAHGLFGSARNWGAIAKRLGDRRPVVAVDMRNHGDSPRDPDNSYEAMAADLVEVIDALGGIADVLGHSMGGKAAMALALTRPALVSRLIVADIAPVAYHHSQLNYVEAMRQIDLAACRRRSDADRLLADAVPEPALRAFFLQSLAFGANGAEWKLNLAVLADQMPVIMDFPRIDARFDGPTLFLTGGASDYLSETSWKKAQAMFPKATRVILPNVGHWLHVEAPGPFIEAVQSFLYE